MSPQLQNIDSQKNHFQLREHAILFIVLVEGSKDTYSKGLTRKMVEVNFGQTQEDFTEFISSTPQERFKALLSKRPGLIHRVPQHQLASYLLMIQFTVTLLSAIFLLLRLCCHLFSQNLT